MKTFLKILAGLAAGFVLIFVGIFAIAWNATSGIAESADKFFTLLKSNNYQEAYNSTSSEFKASTTIADFTNFLKDNNLDKYVSGNWNDRSIVNDQGNLKGTINTTGQGSILVELNFVKEGNAWKILNLRPINSAAQRSTSVTSETNGSIPSNKLELPSDEALVALTNASMTSFANAVDKADFQDFYANISSLWSAQTSAEELKKAFQSFLDQKVDLSFIKGVKPTFSEKPTLDAQDVLVLSGYYPGQEKTAVFTLKFIYEHPTWKLAGIEVNVK